MSAVGAPLLPAVDRTEVVQDEFQVGTFASRDDVVGFAAAGTTRYGMVADPADRAVRGVDLEFQPVPPVPAASHAGAR